VGDEVGHHHVAELTELADEIFVNHSVDLMGRFSNPDLAEKLAQLLST
jgi:hypothetical protein